MKNVKMFGIAALGLSVLSLFGQPLLAQGHTSVRSPNVQAGKHHHGQRLEELAKKLNLTESQETRIRGFLKEHAEKAKEIRGNNSLTPDQKKDRLKELRKDLNQRILGILTDEQKEKFRAMQGHRGNKGGRQANP